MKRLVTFGCSNVYGHGLNDCYNAKTKMPGPKASEHAWPSILSRMMGLECLNLSKPGANNKYIWKRILDTELTKDDFVIVAWSYFDRHCIIRSDKKMQELNIWDADMHTSTKAFFKHVHDMYDMHVDFYLRSNHIQSYLDNKGIKVEQLPSSDSLRLYGELAAHKLHWNTVDFINTNIDIYRSKFPKGLDGRHPGEETHIHFARILYRLIKRRGKYDQE